MTLHRPTTLHKFINELGVHAKKRLSQNFLIDRNILEKIVTTAQVRPGDLVIEIGPGPGALTETLLNAGAEVIAIEMDREFAAQLSRLGSSDKLKVFQADFLAFPLLDQITRPAKVVANLPYHITTPILQKLLPLYPRLTSLTLMVQKEFGERMVAKPRSSAYSSLSLFVQYYSEAKQCFTVRPGCFFPKPTVDYCVVHLDLKEVQGDTEGFFAITRRAFNQRRKMLKTSLKELFPVAETEKALLKLNLPISVRPEELSLEDFKNLSNALKVY